MLPGQSALSAGDNSRGYMFFRSRWLLLLIILIDPSWRGRRLDPVDLVPFRSIQKLRLYSLLLRKISSRNRPLSAGSKMFAIAVRGNKKNTSRRKAGVVNEMKDSKRGEKELTGAEQNWWEKGLILVKGSG